MGSAHEGIYAVKYGQKFQCAFPIGTRGCLERFEPINGIVEVRRSVPSGGIRTSVRIGGRLNFYSYDVKTDCRTFTLGTAVAKPYAGFCGSVGCFAEGRLVGVVPLDVVEPRT